MKNILRFIVKTKKREKNQKEVGGKVQERGNERSKEIKPWYVVFHIRKRKMTLYTYIFLYQKKL